MVITDLKNRILKGLGFSGAIQDQEFKFFKNEGVSARTYPEAFMEWLSGLGFRTGALNDRLKAYLSFLGFSGAIQDSEEKALTSGVFYDTIPLRVKNILAKYSATLLLPGPAGTISYWFQPGNYRESTGQTLAAADQQVGLVVDAARSPGPEIATGNNLSGFSNITAEVSHTDSAFTTTGPTVGVAIPVTVGKYYEVVVAGSTTSEEFSINTYSQVGPARTLARVGFGRCVVKADFPNIYLRNSTAGVTQITHVSVRELPGIHASQPTSGFQPYLRQSGLVNSWQFDGTDDRLSLSAVPFQMSDDHFVVIGARQASAGVRCLFGQGTTNATANQPFFGFNSLNELNVYVRNDAGLAQQIKGPAIAANVIGVYSYLRRSTGALTKIKVDGVDVASSNASLPTSVASSAGVGSNMRPTPSEHFNGHIHCVILGKGAITDAELLVLEKFAASLQGRSL